MYFQNPLVVVKNLIKRMTKVKFIHTADLHLDTPFKGLFNWNADLASKLKDATFKSFKRITDLCLIEKVDFLIISGDIFDSENKSLAAQIRFVSELKRLSENGIPTYFICGNHDPLDSWLDDLQLPENAFRFDSSKIEYVEFKKDKKPVADIYGISFQNKVVKKNLARSYQLRSEPAPISIALLHGTVGIPGIHENYAPFKVNDVENKGFEYWALGHIHKRQIIHKSTPAIVYPGNPQGRDFGEKGAKGCYIVELDDDNAPKLTFVPIQIIRFEEMPIDLSGQNKIDRLPEIIEEAKENIEDFDEKASYILRIILEGRTSLHLQLNKPGEIDQLLDLFNEGQLLQSNFTWVDQIILKTQPDIDIEQVKKRTDFPAEILKTIDENKNSVEKLQELIDRQEVEFTSPQTKRELNELSDSEKKEILEKVQWILLDQLLK
jgi:DNA repair exonuclease SbcCD nuclease subunit